MCTKKPTIRSKKEESKSSQTLEETTSNYIAQTFRLSKSRKKLKEIVVFILSGEKKKYLTNLGEGYGSLRGRIFHAIHNQGRADYRRNHKIKEILKLFCSSHKRKRKGKCAVEKVFIISSEMSSKKINSYEKSLYIFSVLLKTELFCLH